MIARTFYRNPKENGAYFRFHCRVVAYLKSGELGGISSSPRQDVWLLLVAGVSAVLLLVILLALFVLGLGRHKRKQRVEGSANRSRVFERQHSVRGEDNMDYKGDDNESKV